MLHDREMEAYKKQIKSSKIKKIIWAKNIYIVVEHWFGIFRYSYKNGQLLPPNKLMKILSAVIPCAHVVLYVIFFCSSQMYPQNLMELVQKIPDFLILTQYMTYALACSFCLNKHCRRLIDSFADLDSMLNAYTDDSFYNKSRFETKKYIIMLGIFHAVDSILDLFINQGDTVTEIISLPIYFLENLEIVVFCNFILMLQRRLEIINTNLTTFLRENENGRIFMLTVKERRVEPKENPDYIGRPSDHNMKIRNLAAIYDKIGNVCCIINGSFNFQIFLALITAFSYVLIAIWSAIYYYRTPESDSALFMSLFTWCLTIMFIVVMMSIACERLLQTRNSTKILVNKVIMDYDIPKTMRIQAKAFMELIEAWPLQILVYDMFIVDINLILKFTSVATTYLIVIIQLSHFM